MFHHLDLSANTVGDRDNYGLGFGFGAEVRTTLTCHWRRNALLVPSDRIARRKK